MPLYDYRCETCGDVFEVKQRISDDPLTTHENCGGRVERLISVPALQFKGSGWYITDYARASSKGGSAKASQESSESKGSDGKASDGKVSKDAAKAEAPARKSD